MLQTVLLLNIDFCKKRLERTSTAQSRMCATFYSTGKNVGKRISNEVTSVTWMRILSCTYLFFFTEDQRFISLPRNERGFIAPLQ